MAAEGREADVTLAAGAKADTGSAHHIGSVEQLFEELPRAAGARCPHPDVGGVLAAMALKAQSSEHAEHPLGVLHVVVDGGLDLLLAVGGMLIDTILQIFVVPSLFVIFQGLQEKIRPLKFDDEENEEVAAELAQYAQAKPVDYELEK